MDNNRPRRFLRLKEVMQKVGLCKATIYHLMHTGLFPRQYVLRPKCVRWDDVEIEEWMASKKRKGGAK